jgi:hypothetical protein
VSKTLRLSMIATLLLATTVLAVMSYSILNPKPEEPKQEVKQEEPKQEPKPEPSKQRAHWMFPRREEPTTVRIITPNKEGGYTVKKCLNFECG